MSEMQMELPFPVEYFTCCAHCGCKIGERNGHDDTCQQGCNDEEMKGLFWDES